MSKLGMTSNQTKTTKKLGSTLLELLFATMVLVIGLLGIASLIPFAARDAQTSNNHNRAVSLGLAWADNFFARGLHHPNAVNSEHAYRWNWCQDPAGSPTWQNFLSQPLIDSVYITPSAVPRPNDATPYCIDPYLLTSDNPSSLFTRATPYRAAVFPYFDDGWSPLSGFTSPTASASIQPRMIRASFGNLNGVASRKLVESIVSSMDQIVSDTYVDPANTTEISDQLPQVRLFQMNGVTPVRSMTDGLYTWMATVVPNNVGGTYKDNGALVTFVVLHRHSHRINFTAPPEYLGERLVTVVPQSGSFVGGAGGRVKLTCSAEVDSRIDAGDWMMLSRMIQVAPLIFRPVFRWYRIIGLDASPTIDNSTWSRDVVLDGPDFQFDTPTFGTLVGGVVTVVERQIDFKL